MREWNALPLERGQKPFMCTSRPNWLSLSTKFFNKEACHKVPIPLYDILSLDEKNMTVRVEPMVSVGDITRYLIPKGYTLAVTLEIADASLGGLGNMLFEILLKKLFITKFLFKLLDIIIYSFDYFPFYLAFGVGMTTYSHKVGLYQECIEAYDVVIGDGSLVRATRDNEHSDLYHCLPWSHGTLGFLVALELKIIKVQPYVHMKYIPVKGQKKYCDLIREESGANDVNKKTPDYVEATLYNKEDAVVMLGNFATPKTKEEKAKINHITRWYKLPFYKHVETFLEKGETEEYIPLREYLLRHDKVSK